MDRELLENYLQVLGNECECCAQCGTESCDLCGPAENVGRTEFILKYSERHNYIPTVWRKDG